jgi:hypothetical protein
MQRYEYPKEYDGELIFTPSCLLDNAVSGRDRAAAVEELLDVWVGVGPRSKGNNVEVRECARDVCESVHMTCRGARDNVEVRECARDLC